MQAKLLLFTSPTCPYCPRAKDVAAEVAKQRDDVRFEEWSTHHPKGRKKASQFDIRSVPTFIIQGPAFGENIGLAGVQSTETLNKYLDVSLGLRELNQQKERKPREFRIGRFKLRF